VLLSTSGSSIGLASLWHLIEVAQMMYIYRYMNIDFPPNLDNFFEILGFSQMEFIPNAFEYVVSDSMLDSQTAPDRYEELDVNCNFFLNAGGMI
jgi:hypothetical protein